MLKNRTLQIFFFIILAGCIATGLFFYWQYSAKHPSTDDAYISAHQINIAPQITGRVGQVAVSDHQHVLKGQLLFSIEPHPFIIALQKAEADLANTQQQVIAAHNAVLSAQAAVTQRQAELTNTQKATQRTLTLVKRKLESKASGDQAVSNLAVAKAAVEAAQQQLQEAKAKQGKLGDQNASIRAAQAAVNQARLNLSYTHINAPISGYIENFNLRQGATVSAYQSVLTLIDTTHFWAQANFKETQLAHIRAGQPATIKLDMYPKQIFKGVVTKISHGSGSTFSLLPAENATGNWVKVTQRFPIRIDIHSHFKNKPLRIGASATVTVNTATH
jgi:membrane fusion protein (multidrug efflux system)